MAISEKSDVSTTSVENERLRETFLFFDRQGDQKVSVAQLGDVARGMGLSPTQAEVRQLVEHWNAEPEKRISFEEFLPIYTELGKSSRGASADELLDCLSHFDATGEGNIKVADMRHILTNIGERLSDEEVGQLMAELNPVDGAINIADLVHMVTNSSFH